MSDLTPLVLINGQPENRVSVRDRGLTYGDGLFETMRWTRACLPFWPLHRERLSRDCQRLHLTLTMESIEQGLDELARLAAKENRREGVVKIMVTRGVGGRGYLPTADLEPTHVIMLLPAATGAEQLARSGTEVTVCQHRLPDQPALAGIKHLNKLDYVLAGLEWCGTDYHEALLLDGRDRVVEANSRNVFVVKDNRLLTPPVDRAGVAGVMRRLILESYGPAVDLNAMESPLSIADLLAADEVFLSNSVTGIWPVNSIQGQSLPADKPVTRRLQAVLLEDIDRRVEFNGS